MGLLNILKLLIVLISLLIPCKIILASDYAGFYQCEPTFILANKFLLISNGKDDIQILITEPNQEVPIGLVDENMLQKMGMTPEDFSKFKLEQFQDYTFNLKIWTDKGQITQLNKDNEVDTYFHNVLQGGVLMGYTEYTNQVKTDDDWFIRDVIFMGVFDDIYQIFINDLGNDIITDNRNFSGADKVKLSNPLVKNMLEYLAPYEDYYGSWIEISQHETPGKLEFSVKDIQPILNFNVGQTHEFRAICF